MPKGQDSLNKILISLHVLASYAFWGLIFRLTSLDFEYIAKCKYMGKVKIAENQLELEETIKLATEERRRGRELRGDRLSSPYQVLKRQH